MTPGSSLRELPTWGRGRLGAVMLGGRHCSIIRAGEVAARMLDARASLCLICAHGLSSSSPPCAEEQRGTSPLLLSELPEKVALPGLWLCRALRGRPGGGTISSQTQA